jgi:hypothetical protein
VYISAEPLFLPVPPARRNAPVSENDPAQPSDAVPTAPLTPASPPPDTPRRRTALWWILGAIGVLLVVVIVLLVLLLLKPAGTAPAATPSPTPSASATPTLTPTSTPTATSGSNGSSGGNSKPTPTPTAAKAPVISVFSSSMTTVACVTGTKDFPAQLNFDIPLRWSTIGAVKVYIGVDTQDPVSNPYEGPLDPNGSTTAPFSCYGPHTYAITAIGADGQSTTASFQAVNTGDPDPYR